MDDVRFCLGRNPAPPALHVQLTQDKALAIEKASGAIVLKLWHPMPLCREDGWIL